MQQWYEISRIFDVARGLAVRFGFTMNIKQLRQLLTDLPATSLIPCYLRDFLYGLGNRGLVSMLRDGLKQDPDGIRDLDELVTSQFSEGPADRRVLRLYVGVATSLAAGIDHHMMIEIFGAPAVAEVVTQLKNAEMQETRPKGRNTPGCVDVPLALVSRDERGQPTRGVAAGLRLQWLGDGDRPGTITLGLTVRQHAIDRDSRDATGKSWSAAEAIVGAFLQAHVEATRPVGARGNMQAVGGVVRWELFMEDAEAPLPRVSSGDSFGLALVLGFAQLMARCAKAVPVNWAGLRDEELSGVLGMAAVDSEGKLRSVGGAHQKIVEARNGFRTPIRTIVAAAEQRE